MEEGRVKSGLAMVAALKAGESSSRRWRHWRTKGFGGRRMRRLMQVANGRGTGTSSSSHYRAEPEASKR
ncbi:hypothetical protein U1Q18_030048 [Sarracenia purpurea var. burkii]